MELQPHVYRGTVTTGPLDTAQVRLNEAGEAAEGSTSSLRIGSAALHLTAPDATEAYVPFNLITKTHAQGETFMMEGKWSNGETTLGLICDTADTAARMQEAVKAAVNARYTAVQGMLQEAAAAAGAARARRRTGQAAEGAARMVLVVDSEKKFRSKLRTLLGAGGQHALFAKDAFEALDIYDANPAAIACILTELKPTEDMTGWQLTREIRYRERGAERDRTPIFAMTFKHYDETSTDSVKLSDTESKVTRSSNLCHCEQAGMDGYMLKPPTRTKLRTLLTQYLAARQSVGGVRIKGGLMTQALGQSEGGEDELFDAALADFYAKEHWFPKLFFLPALLTRKFMRGFWYLMSCYGMHMKPFQNPFSNHNQLIVF